MSGGALPSSKGVEPGRVDATAEHWLTVEEFATAAGIDPRSARDALAKRVGDSRPWRGAPLRVRTTRAHGGPSGIRYEVEINSLPRAVRDAAEARRLQEAAARKVEQALVPPVVAGAPPAEGAGAATAESTRAALFEERADWFSRQPPGVREEAERRVAWLLRIEGMHSETGLSVSRCAAKVRASFAGEDSPPKSTLLRWHRMVSELPQHVWRYFVAPSWKGKEPHADCDPAALGFIKTDYLRREAPTFSSCYRRLKLAAAEKGWGIPSEDTLRRRIERELGREAIALARKGPDALKRFIPPQERDKSVFHALQAVNADGFDFHVHAQMEDGSIAKPCLVHWQCVYTGKILAWEIGLTESTELYQKSFGRLVQRYGIPQHAYLDNTRAAANKTMTGGTPNRYRFKVKPNELLGILPRLGVQVHWTTPGHGQAKPIERAHRDLRDELEKHPALAGAYAKSGAVPIAKLREIWDEVVANHNDRPGRRSHTCNGRSFNQTFQESYDKHQHLIRWPTEEQCRWLLLAAAVVKTNRESGVFVLHGKRYWSEKIAHYAGRELEVLFDADNLSGGAYAYTSDGRFIGLASCLPKAGFNDVAAAKDLKRVHARLKKLAKEKLALQRRITMKEVAAMLPRPVQEPLPASKVRRGLFGRSGPEDLGSSPAVEASPATVTFDAFDDIVERVALGEKPFNPKAVSS